MNEDRPALSGYTARQLLRTESTCQRCIDYVDILYFWAIVSGGRFSELRPIGLYHGCRALTFALARLSCTRSVRRMWIIVYI